MVKFQCLGVVVKTVTIWCSAGVLVSVLILVVALVTLLLLVVVVAAVSPLCTVRKWGRIGLWGPLYYNCNKEPQK